MKEVRRIDPSFSLCGLNCALCPRFHTEGTSKCPGCGGVDFSSKHPTCAVVTCNRKNDHVEYCFQCSQYPCVKYLAEQNVDSFISYQNVEKNMAEAKLDLPGYIETLNQKRLLLENLIANFNDGRSKGFYCLAVDLLPLAFVAEVVELVAAEGSSEHLTNQEMCKKITVLFKSKASEMQIELKLRK